ncbi:MAG TPA: hypothetical protein VK906_00410 [Egicoccus sp.]|nr:hypothetical protein [Egicoccus sp.]HSK21601.1 hypothetical protein [Egicoccus sp.]
MSTPGQDAPRRPRPHVEVIGLPGAGKTTLLDRLAARGTGDGLSIGRPPDPSRLATALAKARLRTRLALRHRDPAWLAVRDAGTRWLLAKYAFRAAAFARRSGRTPLLLADAGFLEPLVTRATYHGAMDAGHQRALLEYVPRPTAVVHVHCDTDVAFDRFVTRERDLRRLPAGMSLDTLRHNFDVARAVCDELDRWARTEGIDLLEIDATDTPTDSELDRLLSEVLTSTR